MTMSSCSETEDDQFFDTRDDISSVSDSEGCPSSAIADSALGYDFWTMKPNSVSERRDNFLKLMGLNSDRPNADNKDQEVDLCYDDLRDDFDRLMDDRDGVVANPDSEQTEEDNPTWKIKNLDNGTEFVVDQQSEDGSRTTLREVGSDRKISLDELQRTFSSSKFVQRLLQKDSSGVPNMVDLKTKSKSNWLQRFSDKTKGVISKTSLRMGSDDFRGVRVHTSKKRLKELSALYTGQEFPAHEGSILTMKFSFDGRYLASAGVDGVVRVWKVLEDDTLNKFKDQDIDAAGLYMWLDQVSKLGLPNAVKEDTTTMKSSSRRMSNAVKEDTTTMKSTSRRMSNALKEDTTTMKSSSRRMSDLDSVVLPPNVFQLSEKPLHEFHGHEGDVLALSWSKDGSLLSSSVDKTVRLWRVGEDQCLRVYSHNNYVTCVEFNPIDNNHFISGSIDGKLRIWEVEGGRVVDWTDIREIVTAVCYSPDGKGGVVGSMDGNIRFYDVIDNRLELGAEICLKGKKKLPGKRITGFQYCPGDESKVMVTSADSRVRIISGTDIVCKFKGDRISGTQVPASFTADGEHLVSVGEDSKVCVWNYKSSRNKNVQSCESFVSQNASVAVPWGGLRSKIHDQFDEKSLQKLPPFPDCLTTSLGFFLDALYKGSATWPEERLVLGAGKLSSVEKGEVKSVRNAWVSALSNPHMWGVVIVTAGWDGCIRTFLNYGLPVRF